MPYSDLVTIHDPATGTTPPVSWGDAIRDNFEYLVDPPRCGLSGFATTCGTGSFTTLDAGVETYDTAAFHTGTSNQMVIPTGLGGTYLIGARVKWDANATGTRNIGLYLNGADSEPFCAYAAAPTAATDTVQSGVLIMSLAATNTISLRGRQHSGGALDATVLGFWIRWLGR